MELVHLVDYAGEIKDTLTMGDVLSFYGFDLGRQGRIPCPIHNGKDPNFSFRPKRFKCFVCGAEGTVIDFVMLYFGLPFQEAIKKLNDDFRLGLPIGETADSEKLREAKKKAEERRKAREAYQKALKDAQKRYHDALDRWTHYDKVIIENAPQTPFDTPCDEYFEAIKNIDKASYELSEAESALRVFERINT